LLKSKFKTIPALTKEQKLNLRTSICS